MTRYFFDIQDDDGFVEDEEGLELPSIERARKEAEVTLAELAKDLAEQGQLTSTIEIHVREGARPLFSVAFHIQHKVH